MSTLWTPGGEVPVGREPTPQGAEPTASDTADRDDPADPHDTADPHDAARLDEMREHLLGAPAADVVVQHLMAIYELAALHLSADEPRLADARLAIDTVETVLEGMKGRLGQAEEAIAAALPQLKMAFVDASDRVKGG